MADATFITSAMVENEISTETAARIPTLVSAQSLARACRRVVSLIKGTAYEVPAQADAPGEWQYLAVEWLAASGYERYPEYFRAKYPTIEDLEKRIVRTARIEPLENNTHALSAGTPADAWDYPSCSGEYGGILP